MCQKIFLVLFLLLTCDKTSLGLTAQQNQLNIHKITNHIAKQCQIPEISIGISPHKSGH